MLHVFEGELEAQIRQALEDLDRLQPYVQGVIVENYDIGYLDASRATAEMAQRLAFITRAVVERSQIPVGLNVLPNDYWNAFRIAGETGARFIQLDHVTGDFVGCESVDPADYSRYRRRYPTIVVLGGVHPKYYELVDPSTSIRRSAQTAQDLADAVVVTGTETGIEASLDDLRTVRAAIGDYPLLVGSGLTAANADQQLSIADGAIVGTAFKRRGVVPGETIDEKLVEEFMQVVANID